MQSLRVNKCNYDIAQIKPFIDIGINPIYIRNLLLISTYN
ncbi:hypothetical protein PPBDW_II0562 [Photobacterium kishitanii]|nr:hypothetical protein PPBDW_II0562 [Photobacterium kishitanii]